MIVNRDGCPREWRGGAGALPMISVAAARVILITLIGLVLGIIFFLFVSSLILFWSCVEFCIFTYRNCICSGRSIRSGNVYVFFLYSTSVGRDVMSPSGVRSGH